MVYRRSARSEAVRAEARERILKAAFKLLTERGYDATTMQDVVAEAGTSIGNAYFYFGSKEALIRELIEREVKRVMNETESAAEAIPAGPPRIGQMIAARVGAFTNGQRNLAQLLLGTDQRLGTLEMVEDLTVERWLPQLAISFPDRPAEELPAAAASIWAVNRIIIQRVLQGKLKFDSAAAVRFAVTWSLRALEVPEPEIESIVQAGWQEQNALTKKRAGKTPKKRTKTR
jgi:AcrR family transcriptional regulator